MIDKTSLTFDEISSGPQQTVPTDPFENFMNADKAAFVRWLRVGLENYWLADKGRWAFRPFELWIGRDFDLALDLYQIYLRFPPSAQAEWREAVTEILAELQAEPKHIPIFETLLSLTRMVPIYEALRVLPSIVGEGPLGAMQAPDGDSLFVKVMVTAAELAAQTEAARSCIQFLTTSRYFTETYAGLAFISLCRADPDNWPAHLARMRPALTRMRISHQLDTSAHRSYALQFLSTVGADKFCKHLNALRLDSTFQDDIESDQWLWEALFEAPSAPLATVLGEGIAKSVAVSVRKEPAVIIEIEPTVYNSNIAYHPHVGRTEAWSHATPGNDIGFAISRAYQARFGHPMAERYKTSGASQWPP